MPPSDSESWRAAPHPTPGPHSLGAVARAVGKILIHSSCPDLPGYRLWPARPSTKALEESQTTSNCLSVSFSPAGCSSHKFCPVCSHLNLCTRACRLEGRVSPRSKSCLGSRDSTIRDPRAEAPIHICSWPPLLPPWQVALLLLGLSAFSQIMSPTVPCRCPED